MQVSNQAIVSNMQLKCNEGSMKEVNRYYYSDTFKCLVQTNEQGEIIQSMSMPIDDLDKISFLSWVMNNEQENNLKELVKTEDSVL